MVLARAEVNEEETREVPCPRNRQEILRSGGSGERDQVNTVVESKNPGGPSIPRRELETTEEKQEIEGLEQRRARLWSFAENVKEDVKEKTVDQLGTSSKHALYVSVDEKEVFAVIDTGADVTILQDKVFLAMKNPPPVLRRVRMRGAGRGMRMSGLIVGPVALKIGRKVYRENIFVAPISFQMLLGGDILNNRGETETVVFLKSRVLFFDGQSMELMSLGAEEDQVGEVSLEERRWIPPDSDVRVAAKLSTEDREDYVIEPTHESKVGLPQVVRKGDTEPVGCRVNIRSRRNWEKKRKSRKDKLKDVECACVDLSGPGMGDSWGWLLSEGPGLEKEDLQVFGEMDLDSEKFVYSTTGGVDCEGLPNGVCKETVCIPEWENGDASMDLEETATIRREGRGLEQPPIDHVRSPSRLGLSSAWRMSHPIPFEGRGSSWDPGGVPMFASK